MALLTIFAGFPLSIRDIAWPLGIIIVLLAGTAVYTVLAAKPSLSRGKRIIYVILAAVMLFFALTIGLLTYFLVSDRVFFFQW